MALLDWPPPDHLWIGRKSRQFLPSQRFTNARVSIPAENLALGPSCVSPTPQLKREQSPGRGFGKKLASSCSHRRRTFERGALEREDLYSNILRMAVFETAD